MKTLTLILLLFISIPIEAGPNGTSIMPGCEILIDTDKESNPTAGYCAGVMNTIIALHEHIPNMCLPKNINTFEMAKVVLMWYDEPENLDYDFIGLSIMVLSVVYSCTRYIIPDQQNIGESNNAKIHRNGILKDRYCKLFRPGQENLDRQNCMDYKKESFT